MTHNPKHNVVMQESSNPDNQTPLRTSIVEQVAKKSLNAEDFSSQHDTSTHYFDEFWRVDDEDPFLLHKEASRTPAPPATGRTQENSPFSALKADGNEAWSLFVEEEDVEKSSDEEEKAEFLTLEMELPSDFFEDTFEVTDEFVSTLLGMKTETTVEDKSSEFDITESADDFEETWEDWNESSSTLEEEEEEFFFDDEEEFDFLDDSHEETTLDELEEYISLPQRNQQLFFSLCWEYGCDENEWEVLLPALENSGNLYATFKRLHNLHTVHNLDVQELCVVVSMRHYAQTEFELALTYEQCALLLQGNQSILCEEEVFEILDSAFFSWKRSQARSGNHLEGYSFFEHCQQFRHLEEMDAVHSHPAIVDKSLEMTFEEERCFSNHELDMSLHIDPYSTESKLWLSSACKEDTLSLHGQAIQWNPGEWW